MKLSLQIAIRYLFAKKSQNIINIISWISVSGVLTGSLGLLVVLSVFNGLHGLIGSLYSSFDPDLKIEPLRGKVFSIDSLDYSSLVAIEGVDAITGVVEDHVLFRFGKRQVPGRIMGVDSLFNRVSSIDSIIVDGQFRLMYHGMYEGVMGYALADQLGVRLNFVTPLMIYAPERTGRINPARPDQSFRSRYLQPSGIYMVSQLDYDAAYTITHIDQARDLFDYDASTFSWMGIKIADGRKVESVKQAVSKLLGNDFRVRNREEQHETFFRMMKVEKLMAYLILSFILLIAIFNVIGTLSMLIFEKRESIGTLRSMGADRQLINRIFLFEGWLISLAGMAGGLLLGSLLVWLQQTFGFIRFHGAGNFVVDAYPVVLRWPDLVTVFVTVSLSGFLAAWYPVRVIVRRYFQELGDK
ncbi:ABC transporter permease [Alkaliflexus imshenetskii]|uniref:ABC transporter permease n=1 Tax=Alkaliflexus imshenetskii TaxID=286730 RepID=UPI00047DA879|nr:FtsX-like permease family protein [Alkaliflexus imshenetskii]